MKRYVNISITVPEGLNTDTIAHEIERSLKEDKLSWRGKLKIGLGENREIPHGWLPHFRAGHGLQ